MAEEKMPLINSLVEHWWVPVLRGAVAILLGILLLASPKMGLFVLVVMWGTYAFLDGLFNLLMAARGPRPGERRGWLIFEGIVSVAAGVVTFAWPQITALALLMVIAAWALLTGIAEIAAAISQRKQLRHAWLLGLGGALSVAFGILLFAFPSTGALAVLWMIGVYAIVFGGSLVAFGLQLRTWRRPTEERRVPTEAPTPARA